MKKFFNLLSLIIVFAACSDSTTEADYYCETKSITFEQDGGTVPVKIMSDYPLYIVQRPAWVNVSPTSGSGTFTVNVVAGANATGSQLSGEIVVGTQSGNADTAVFEIEVIQKAQ